MLHAFKEAGVDANSVSEISLLLDCLRSEIPKKSNTLCERLGGVTAIEKAVKKLYEEKMPLEEKLKEFFKKVDLK
jgi:hypothetical protein